MVFHYLGLSSHCVLRFVSCVARSLLSKAKSAQKGAPRTCRRVLDDLKHLVFAVCEQCVGDGMRLLLSSCC